MHPYATAEYAATLEHVGNPYFVPEWQSHVMVRRIKDDDYDACGPYPLTCLSPIADLAGGLQRLKKAGIVSVTFVTDALVGPRVDHLARSFPLVRPFKTHYLVDMQQGVYSPSKHHHDRTERARRRGVMVHRCELRDVIDEWTQLYADLVAKKGITGPARFESEAFISLTRVEGLTATVALLQGRTVACQLWIEHDGMCWSHLTATSEEGYRNGATFAIYDHSIRAFPGHVLNLGGAAGLVHDPTDGLGVFKAGFSNRSQTAILCGAILDEERYKILSSQQVGARSDYFPRYRSPT